MNVLQDPNFILALAVGVVTFIGIIVIPVLFFLKQQSRKGISFELISDSPVLQGHAQIKEEIEVRLRDSGKIVDSLNQIVMRIWNSGNQTIKSGDIDVPFRIRFDEKTEVIRSGYSSESIPARISFPDAHSVQLTIDSINPKEDLLLFVLVTEYRRNIQYRAHIVGGVVREKKTGPGWHVFFALPALIGAIGLTLGSLVTGIFVDPTQRSVVTATFLIFTIVALAVLPPLALKRMTEESRRRMPKYF